MALAMMFLMIFCVKEFEVEAYLRGEVSMEQPRALYNTTPGPSWPIALPADDTIFMPPNRRSRSIYDDMPPPAANNESTSGDSSIPSSDDVEDRVPAPTSQEDFALMVANEGGVEPGDMELGNFRGNDGDIGSSSGSDNNNIISGENSSLDGSRLQSMGVSSRDMDRDENSGGGGKSRIESAIEYESLQDSSEHHK